MAQGAAQPTTGDGTVCHVWCVDGESKDEEVERESPVVECGVESGVGERDNKSFPTGSGREGENVEQTHRSAANESTLPVVSGPEHANGGGGGGGGEQVRLWSGTIPTAVRLLSCVVSGSMVTAGMAAPTLLPLEEKHSTAEETEGRMGIGVGRAVSSRRTDFRRPLSSSSWSSSLPPSPSRPCLALVRTDPPVGVGCGVACVPEVPSTFLPLPPTPFGLVFGPVVHDEDENGMVVGGAEGKASERAPDVSVG